MLIPSTSDGIRQRRPWDPERDSWLHDELKGVSDLLEDDVSVLTEEDDGVGCPLPSTPEDEHLLDCEVLIFI